MKIIDIPEAPEVDPQFARRVYNIILILSISWIILLIAPPLLLKAGGIAAGLSDFLYIAFSPLCHQDADRSFTIAGEQFAVCSRCTMIYTGFTAGIIAYPLVRKLSNINPPSLLLLIIPTALLLIDAVLDSLGILKNTFLTRSATGFAAGFGLSFFIVPGSIRFFFEIFTFKNKKAGEKI